jgi:peptide/nickel transport system substrate-binding protein
LAVIGALALVGAACSGTDEGAGAGGRRIGEVEAGEPTPGGELVYALEAETTGGWCLPEATLALSGIQVVRAIYDTLTTPDDEGGFAPYLAESVEPDESFTRWTVVLRDGVTFHDGSPLTAQVVKNNLDAYLGRYPARRPLLFPFVLDPVETVEVLDGRTVQITTDRPWPALPAYLYGGGRLGIMAQAQLDDATSCDRNLIGTGPFVLEEWQVNERLSATRNPDYWLSDPDGRQLPYLDRIEFRPVVDEDVRLNALLAGEVQAMHTSSAVSVDTLEAERDAGAVGLVQSLVRAEVSYLMFNVSRPPFDSRTARLAVARAFDREQWAEVRALGQFPLATGAFPEGTPGYLADSGFPSYDLEEARRLVAAYEEETGRPLELTYVFAGGPEAVAGAQYAQEQLAKAGIEVRLRSMEQASLISTALGDDWDLMPYRNLPGGVPDGNYVWWRGGSPVNFGKFDDPEVNELMDAGRVETDPEAARRIYEDVNRELSAEVYNLWLNWVEWNIGTAPDVHGIGESPLPDGRSEGEGLSTGHNLTGVWIEP